MELPRDNRLQKNARVNTKKSPIAVGMLSLCIALVPLIVVLVMLYRAKPDVDIFQGAERLNHRIEAAHEAGFSFEEAALLPKGIEEKDNSLPTIRRLCPNLFSAKEGILQRHAHTEDSIWGYETRGDDGFPRQVQMGQIYDESLAPETIEYIRTAKAIGQFKHLSGHLDLDQYENIDGHAVLKRVDFSLRALCFNATFASMRGNADEALESLRLARNLFLQMQDDPTATSFIMQSGAYWRFLASSTRAIAELTYRPDTQREIKNLMDSIGINDHLDKILNFEFYGTLAYFRNNDVSALTPLVEDNFPPHAHDEPQQKLIDTGIPKSLAIQARLAAYIDYCLELRKLVRSALPPAKLKVKIDELNARTNTDLIGRTVTSSLMSSLADGPATRAKRIKELYSWATEIVTNNGKEIPSKLPPRKSEVLGGMLRYRTTSSGFYIYWDGPNRIDEGGLPGGASDAPKSDDIGIGVELRRPPAKLVPVPGQGSTLPFGSPGAPQK